MKVFLSWSGEESRQVALALHDWLPMITQTVEPWMSEADIAAGKRWWLEVGRELQDSNFGVLCLTKNNLSAPWVLFEAGALAKSLSEGAVCPLLFEIEVDQLPGPLSQFSAKKADKTGLLELVTAINIAAGEPLTRERLSRLYDKLWPDLDVVLKLIPTDPLDPRSQTPKSTNERISDLAAAINRLEQQITDINRRIVLYPRVRETLRTTEPDKLTLLSLMSGVPISSLTAFVNGQDPSEEMGKAILREYDAIFNPGKSGSLGNVPPPNEGLGIRDNVQE